ncbi:MAG: hypothetical protein NTW96_27655 [Planctomycetia bacterium]|nr:hypothetical protein [Planctomycetia bacterium]
MTRKKNPPRSRDHHEPQVAEYLAEFQVGVLGGFLRTETLYQGYLAWLADKQNGADRYLTLIDFARAVRAVNPAQASRRRRGGRQCRGWSLWPRLEVQKYLPVNME